MTDFVSEESLIARNLANRAKAASTSLSRTSSAARTAALQKIAMELLVHGQQKKILEANQLDCSAAVAAGVGSALLDRLRLDEKRLASLADSVAELAQMPDPVGSIEDLAFRPSGLQVGRMLVPLGVVLMIYESRPNVTIDAAALCLKTGNSVILRGGKEARNSNRAFASLLRSVLEQVNLPEDSVQFVEPPEHSFLHALLKQQGSIDVAIPRGGEKLIRSVMEHSRIPVIQHFKGVCHVYVEKSADLKMAENIIINAKTSRPGVCNALEGIVVDEAVAADFVPSIVATLTARGVEVRACARAIKHLDGHSFAGVKAASDDDFDREFLNLTCTLAVVSGMDEALQFLDRHGSKHTESIITQNYESGLRFLREVDASCVLVNASTRFNDGGELGLGAELGISTSKLHAYGPMGLRELCARKFVVFGHGEVR
ncbi:glutamate-5-semialdehyde dehydrogenase [bacterium]|nr:glutamate-5-semialdehyde dehydrogenase [bacterium]